MRHGVPQREEAAETGLEPRPSRPQRLHQPPPEDQEMEGREMQHAGQSVTSTQRKDRTGAERTAQLRGWLRATEGRGEDGAEGSGGSLRGRLCSSPLFSNNFLPGGIKQKKEKQPPS